MKREQPQNEVCEGKETLIGTEALSVFFNRSTFSSACPGIWADAATRWPAAQLMDTCAAGWERQTLRGDTFQTAPQPSVSSALCRLFWLESFFFIKPNTSLKSEESALLVSLLMNAAILSLIQIYQNSRGQVSDQASVTKNTFSCQL